MSSANESLANASIRVDSHGHIHVRNNQSITVHVDIEPPRRFNSTGAPARNASESRPTLSESAPSGPVMESSNKPLTNGTQKRISSRDTAAVSQSERDYDIRRVKPASSSSNLTTSAQETPTSEPTQRTADDKAPNESEATGPVSGAALKRKPRMLCIEVESNDSDLRRLRGSESAVELGGRDPIGSRLQTSISPDI